MFDQGRVGENGFERIIILTQTHFVIKIMQAVMTKPADHYAAAQFALFIFLFEKVTALDFFRDQMMKG